MDSLAKILSLKGQVWAESATGERRLLNVGDQLTVDESLKMDAGAQVDLDFGNNQLLTFLGEQQFNAEQSSEFFNENQNLLPLQSNADQTRLQVERQAEVTPSPQSPNVVSEGHGFLQLVRIGEIIEADGMTPVTVALIGEVLRPFGMALPLKELPKDEHKEYDYKREQPPRNLSEGIFIKLEPGSGAKGVYNQLDTEDGKVSGTISFDPEIILPGDKITVTDKDGNPLLSSKGVPLLNYVLTPNDISQGFNVDVPVVEGQ